VTHVDKITVVRVVREVKCLLGEMSVGWNVPSSVQMSGAYPHINTAKCNGSILSLKYFLKANVSSF
jgi:hypothetical protein